MQNLNQEKIEEMVESCGIHVVETFDVKEMVQPYNFPFEFSFASVRESESELFDEKTVFVEIFESANRSGIELFEESLNELKANFSVLDKEERERSQFVEYAITIK